ncbi:SixA phosphatase family protein [Brucella gallinifaecis]|uniref:Histidine phosphatase family protein n=1 Tax=Brucella gallinifaecis TaxID=215590 RepID=A0A502BRC2_9HYPH|nr:histidine phosphatase family protein [Brucella gallinifaecis]TPF75826.1 histidine phosphatase family protein [Brucella gallinifaecis]
MSRLFLLRHAKAQWAKPSTKDFDRPLEEEGIASLENLAQAMQKAGTLPECIVLSASHRTRQTAEILVECLGIDVEMIIDDTIYSGGAAEYLQSIKNNAGSRQLMLVGHNPSIEDLALALCNDGHEPSMARLEAGFPTAALAIIAFDGPLSDIAPGKGYLESFPHPH